MTENISTIGLMLSQENAVDDLVKAMTQNGKLKKEHTDKFKKKMATKTYMNKILTEELGVPKELYDDDRLNKIHYGKRKGKDNTMKEIIFLHFKYKENSNIVIKATHNVDKEISEKIVKFVHPKGYQRWKYIDSIAWGYRQKGFRTKVFIGKQDYLLNVKTKEDATKWGDLAPIIIEGSPEFDVGQLTPTEVVKEQERREEQKKKTEEINAKIEEQKFKVLVQKEKYQKELSEMLEQALNKTSEHMDSIHASQICKHQINNCEKCKFINQELEDYDFFNCVGNKVKQSTPNDTEDPEEISKISDLQ